VLIAAVDVADAAATCERIIRRANFSMTRRCASRACALLMEDTWGIPVVPLERPAPGRLPPFLPAID